ncbi:hypothetical protein ACPV5L_02315 [Vibrio astriarenae]|uniref:hypothetical protein n=1 Tax=Vibrio agarivorans TaxID=153622 RepID=UPI00223220BE|nr:hypothetical protein [Vibrio agarivorans]MDN3660505.1 hypothetical protein [Vibrio agarivorans]
MNNMSYKNKISCLISLSLIYGCVSRDVYVEKPELEDVPGYKGVNVSEMWRGMTRNNNNDEVQIFEPLKLEFEQTAFFTFDNSVPYMVRDEEVKKVFVVELPDITKAYNAEIYSYSHDDGVFKPIVVLADAQFTPVSDQIVANWVERDGEIANYFYTNIKMDNQFSLAKYILVFYDSNEIGEDNFAWDARYNYYKENGTDYPRDYTLVVKNSEIGVLSVRAY